ncbi:hypothetical protein [Breoghania sp. L-A4]|uniref:hypothetical protein n=1 Tax=Breoghania sp. L-A4 TaxID=2304600 RepID=UPI000E35A133|nr:hypothetical protein [Breoghania sp. L-A4]AXS41118.1 hypothetical protein D1F64_15195 [Breoghania sp. L-A4]
MSADAILANLNDIAELWRWLAVVWHLYYAALAVGLFAGLRPVKRLAGIMLGIPLFSVSALAWTTGNPFNGTAFAVAGVVLAALPVPAGRVRIAPWWMVLPGAALFAFGWVYPHFTGSLTLPDAFHAAPTGLLPCPTLAMTIGLALALGGLSRAWSLILGALGVFYGAVGLFLLHVTIDAVLLIGAIVLMAFVMPAATAKREANGAQP